MNIEINIDRQPVAARGVVARQISYKEMWEKVREAADKLFVALQKATLDKEAMAGELAAAKLEITKLTADNKRLINDNLNQLERIVSLWEMYQTAASKLNAKESSKNAQKGQGCDKNALNEQSSTRIHTEAVADSVPVQNWTGINEPVLDSAIDYKLTILNLESQLEMAKKLLSHRDKGYLEKYKLIEEYQKMLDSMTTDSRIAELLAAIDQVAIDYGSLGFGLPIHVPAIKERMFDAVRNWISGK